MGGEAIREDIREARGKATEAGLEGMESEFNTPAGAEDFIHTVQAKAAIPEKGGRILAATGQVMGTEDKEAMIGEAIRGEVRFTQF